MFLTRVFFLEPSSDLPDVAVEQPESAAVEAAAAGQPTQPVNRFGDDEEDEDSMKLYLEPDTAEMDWFPSSQKTPGETTVNEKSRYFLCGF
jgi:hypothetical protein